MAKYCQEKFESESTGEERWIWWRQDKHIHDASLITAIEKWLEDGRGGKWKVRANSYMSNQSSQPINATALEYG